MSERRDVMYDNGVAYTLYVEKKLFRKSEVIKVETLIKLKGPQRVYLVLKKDGTLVREEQMWMDNMRTTLQTFTKEEDIPEKWKDSVHVMCKILGIELK